MTDWAERSLHTWTLFPKWLSERLGPPRGLGKHFADEGTTESVTNIWLPTVASRALRSTIDRGLRALCSIKKFSVSEWQLNDFLWSLCACGKCCWTLGKLVYVKKNHIINIIVIYVKIDFYLSAIGFVKRLYYLYCQTGSQVVQSLCSA